MELENVSERIVIKSASAYMIFIIQMMVVLIYGYSLSALSAPEDFLSSTSSFIVTSIPLLLFPALGILGLIIGVRLIRKKIYSLTIWILLIGSILFVTITVPLNISRKIAGMFNYQWTDQATQQRTLQAQQQMQENQVLQQQESSQNIAYNERVQLISQLYELVKTDVNGQHKIIGTDPTNFLVKLDTGGTYKLNIDPVINHTADSGTIDVYNEIIGGEYKTNTYNFSIGNLNSFEAYYIGIFTDKGSIQNAINNYTKIIFIIPIPQKITT